MPARTVILEKAHQVQRRIPRRHHPRRVHPADRTRRPPRHRHRRPRRRHVAPRHVPRTRGNPRLNPHLPAELLIPPHLQHGGKPHRLLRRRTHPQNPGILLRTVPGRQIGRGRRLPRTQKRKRPRRLPRSHGMPPGRLHRIRPAQPPHRRTGKEGVQEQRAPRPRAGTPQHPAAATRRHHLHSARPLPRLRSRHHPLRFARRPAHRHRSPRTRTSAPPQPATSKAPSNRSHASKSPSA